MKSKLFLGTLATAALLLSACASQKQVKHAENAAFKEVYDMPCGGYHDTAEKFAATGIFRGPSHKKGQCHLNAIANAKAIIREKYQHAYKGMTVDYSSTTGTNSGNDVTDKIERVGKQVIDAMLNDAQEVCAKFSGVQDDGMIECYVAIEIPKADIADNVVKKISQVLTDEEKLKIDFNEMKLRQRLEEEMQKQK